MIELRSDSFTLPSQHMRDAMAAAALGDDRYGTDPTVERLERVAAEVTGKPAACLMPSGTMANLAAVLAHARHTGRDVLVGTASHMYRYESAGAALCGVRYRPVPSRPDGRLCPDELAVAMGTGPGTPLPALICLENTNGDCGGTILAPEYHAAVARLAAGRGIPVHLDGARIFNAAVASGLPVTEFTRHVDSVQFCLSKGLRAPLGAVLAGSAGFVAAARSARRMLGGDMHQAGVIAAAGIVALDETVDRLADDHLRARQLAEELSAVDGIKVDAEPRTNIVLFDVLDDRFDVPSFLECARRAGLALGSTEPVGDPPPGGGGARPAGSPTRIRAVTHAGVGGAAIVRALSIMEEILDRGPLPAGTPERRPAGPAGQHPLPALAPSVPLPVVSLSQRAAR